MLTPYLLVMFERRNGSNGCRASFVYVTIEGGFKYVFRLICAANRIKTVLAKGVGWVFPTDFSQFYGAALRIAVRALI